MIKPHKIVGTLIASDDPKLRTYEAIYETTDPIINDHRVYGAVIIPGSFHLARLFAAVCYDYNIATFNLTEIKFANPLVIKDGNTAKVSMTITQENDSTYSFIILSETVMHAAGVFVTCALTNAKLTDEALLTSNEVAIDKFDAYFKRCHLTYGPEYKWFTKLFANDSSSLCFMRGPNSDNELKGLLLHPGQIDCSFQGFLCIKLALVDSGGTDDAWILGGISQIKIYKQPQGKLKCRNIMLNYNDFTVESRKIIGDIAFFDEKNNLIADFIGVVAVKVSTDKIKGLAQS